MLRHLYLFMDALLRTLPEFLLVGALLTRTAVTIRNAQLDVYGVAADNGYIRVYDGTRPATPETAIGAQVLLAELRFAADAFPAASGGGPLTAGAITDDASIDATGTATWYRLYQSNGTTVIGDGTAGVGASFNLNLNSAALQAGARLSISSFTHTLPMDGA
jgi:hypothetical protein